MLHVTTGNSPTSLSVTTLFDTGANPTSFVNMQVAAWIESQQSPQAHGKRKLTPVPLAAVSLAGTSQSSPIHVRMRHSIACTRTSSTAALTSLSAALLFESIISFRKFLITSTSSRPDLSQSVTPVTPSLAKLSRVCVQPCTTFVMQGYDNTLCSLTMKSSIALLAHQNVVSMTPCRRVCRHHTD